MMKQIGPFLIATLFSVHAFAQEKAPLLTGKVTLSIQEGTFDCDLTLSDIPRIDDYFIRLNSGMNLLHFRSLKPDDFLIYYDKSFHDSTSTGESNAYYFSGNQGKGKFLPQSVRFRYVGKYPVVKDTLDYYSVQDWKGNIAFNHNSVRTDATQSAWYPILYDVAHDKSYEDVRYDIEISCKDCNALYVNGNVPVKASVGRFKNDIPEEISLFCGNYDFVNTGNTYILNPDLNTDQIKEFSGLINSYKAFYVDKLGIPFKQAIVFVQTTPTSARDSWLFVSYPTIFNIGWGEGGLVSIFDPGLQNWFRPFIAHELGHYYFGTHRIFNSPLGDMMSEGFAEFLSLKLTDRVIGQTAYAQKMDTQKELLQNFEPVPFGKVKSKSDYKNRELYVYFYAPVIFLAVEKEIGEKQMWEWLRALLETPATFTDYAFLVSTLRTTLNDEKQLAAIKSRYFENDKSLENAWAKIAEK